MMEPAPLHRDIMHPAPEGSAWWLQAPDGVRLRLATWPTGRRGTILFFNGRTEYIEKYGMAAREFGERGFAFATMDWRGQGLSDSDGSRPGLCHVDDFSEFQLDIRAACDAMTEIELPRPFFLVAHSMGGAIGLRALQKGVPVNAAMFCAPMWRIYLSRFVRRAAKYLSSTATRVGLSRQFVIGSGRRNYVELSSPGRNRLTSDVAMYTFLRKQLHHRPELTRGGPSYGWISAALRESRSLLEEPPPRIPTVVLLGSDEKIIDPKAVRIICGNWPEAELELLPGARHELLMETEAIRQHVFDRATAFFSSYS